MDKYPSTGLICAIDLGGTNFRAANIDLAGKIHHRLKKITPASAYPAGIVKEISAAVRECEAAAAESNTGIKAVSVVVPGSVHAETGVIVNAPNIPSLPGFNLGAALKAELNHEVLLENDANAAALGELWHGAARGCRTIICLTLGTGVGSGMILDGQLWRGIDGTAGEIGHTSIDPFGDVPCKCGSVGCLEVYASATAIVRITREALMNNHNSSLHSLSASELTAERISREAFDGDELAREIFQRVGAYLGIAIADLVNTFNPERIVIGGGVSAALDLFLPQAREELMKRAFPVPAKRCQIVKAECGDDAGLLGAAWLAVQNHSP